MSEFVERLKLEFQDEDYRYAYDEEFSNARIATQIKVLREQQELRQSDLAELAEMRQSRICELENVNYNAWSISTLRRLARALGVRLSVTFESWGELLPEIESFGQKSLQRPKFEKDPVFNRESVMATKESVLQESAVSARRLAAVPQQPSSSAFQQTLSLSRPHRLVEINETANANHSDIGTTNWTTDWEEKESKTDDHQKEKTHRERDRGRTTRLKRTA